MAREEEIDHVVMVLKGSFRSLKIDHVRDQPCSLGALRLMDEGSIH